MNCISSQLGAVNGVVVIDWFLLRSSSSISFSMITVFVILSMVLSIFVSVVTSPVMIITPVSFGHTCHTSNIIASIPLYIPPL